MGKVKDLTGETFGRLTVIRFTGINEHHHSEWECLCSCGGTIVVMRPSLRQGRTSSCGCLRVENGRKATALLVDINSKGDDITYARAHQRVSESRGSASTHACTDCGARADDWSLKRSATSTLSTRRGSREDGLIFSTNIEDYEPRCRKCHSDYDQGGELGGDQVRQD